MERHPRRTVTARTQKLEYHDYKRGYGFYTTSTITLTLECGHEKIFHGDRAPKHATRCEACPAEFNL